MVEDWHQYVRGSSGRRSCAFLLAFEEPGRDPADARRQLQRLADAIAAPPYRWTPDVIWHAYQELGEVKGNGSSKGVAELMATSHGTHSAWTANCARSVAGWRRDLRNWLAQQEQAGTQFTVNQVWWLERIAHAIANRLAVTEEDLDGVPFTERGGVDGFVREFGDDRVEQLLDELNRNLPA